MMILIVSVSYQNLMFSFYSLIVLTQCLYEKAVDYIPLIKISLYFCFLILTYMKRKFLLIAVIFFNTYVLFGQDLILESVTYSPSYYQHDQFVVEFTIKNIGILPTQTAYAVAYLTTNPSENQRYFADITIPALESNETYTYMEYGLPIDIAAGTYTFVAQVKTYGDWEVNTENNRYIGTEVEIIASTADLTITEATPLSTSISKGGLLEFNIKADNSGSPTLRAWVTAYLSEDEILDDDDIKLGKQEDYIYFAYNSNYSTTISYAIPYQQALGDYYVILVINENSFVTEVDYDNNQAVISNIAIIDSDIQLEITDAYTTYSYEDYEFNFIDLNIEIRNLGTTNSSTQLLQFYSSYDGETPENLLYETEVNYITIKPYQGWYPSEYFFEHINFYGYRDFNFIIIENTDPNFPLIAPFTVELEEAIPPNYNFEINSFQFNPQPETSDETLNLAIELYNPNSNSIGETLEFNINLTSLDGEISETFIVNRYFNLWSNATRTIDLNLGNRASLLAGEYNVSISVSIPSKGIHVGPASGSMSMIESEYAISVDIIGNEGELIDKGKVYLYEKIDEHITYLGNQEIAVRNGVGNVSFQKSSGNYMFFAVPDIATFPDYIPTVSGNTFTLESSSFLFIDSDQNLTINLIYVDPAPLSGNKLIEGNVVDGTSTMMLSLSSVASSVFSETAVYLLSEGVVIAKTFTDSNGAFSFHNVPEGDFDLYFDDGDIIENNDINISVNLEIEDDILVLEVSENGEVQSSPLNMDLVLVGISTESLNTKSENLNLELQIQGNTNNDLNAFPVDFIIQIEQNGAVLESFSFSEILTVSQNTQQNLSFNPTLSQRLNPGEYQIKITYSSEFKEAGLEEIFSGTTVLNNSIAFRELSITNELDHKTEVLDLALQFAANEDNDIIDLSTVLRIAIFSGDDVVFDEEVTHTLNITSGSVETLFLSSILNSVLQAGNYTLAISYSTDFMEVPFAVEPLDFEIIPIINNTFTFQELSITKALTTESELLEIAVQFEGNQDNDIANLNTTFHIAILSGDEVVFEDEISKPLNITSGSNTTLALTSSLKNTLAAGNYILLVSYTSEFMEAPYVMDRIPFEVTPTVNYTVNFQELAITNELDTESEELEITVRFTGNQDNDIINLNTTFYLTIYSGTTIVFEDEISRNLTIANGSVETVSLSSTLVNLLQAGYYILAVYYTTDYMETPYVINGLPFEVRAATNREISFRELSITNEVNTETEVLDIALQFAGNKDNDIANLSTTFNIAILSGAEIIFEDELNQNINIASGSVETLALSSTLSNKLEAGNYTLAVSYYNDFMDSPYVIDGLTFEVKNYVLLNTAGQLVNSDQIAVYPNPTNGIISIEHNFNYLEMFDVNGKKVLSMDNIGFSGQVDLSNLAQGLYILKFESNNTYNTVRVLKK